jgi:hypothetical protein
MALEKVWQKVPVTASTKDSASVVVKASLRVLEKASTWTV